MAYGLSNGHVTDDVTWPPKVLWASTVGYPSDSFASCFERRLFLGMALPYAKILVLVTSAVNMQIYREILQIYNANYSITTHEDSRPRLFPRTRTKTTRRRKNDGSPHCVSSQSFARSSLFRLLLLFPSPPRCSLSHCSSPVSGRWSSSNIN